MHNSEKIIEPKLKFMYYLFALIICTFNVHNLKWK
jgi:hypothetical protein